MPLVFTRDQIRSYLQDQGYNVNESELDAFIHDLKRVVKHEDRKRRRKRLGHDSEDTRLDTTTSTTSPDEGEYYLLEDEDEDEGVHSSAESPTDQEEFSAETSEELASQSVKLVTKPETSHSSLFSKQSGRTKHSVQKQLLHENQQENKTDVPSNYIVMDRRTMILDDNNEPVVVNSKVPIPVDVTDKAKEKKLSKKSQPLITNTSNIIPKNVHLISAQSKKSSAHKKENVSATASLTNSRQKSSSYSSSTNTDELHDLLQKLMPEPEDSESDPESLKKRSIGPPDKIKRDPVALYHFYKSIWDKQKLPGHNRHMKLRWNVRAQTVGTYPCMNGQPVKYLR